MKFNQLNEVSNHIAEIIKNGGSRHIFFIEGEMGAGKTTLVSQILSKFDKKIASSSPTFTIINHYADNIFHIDLYRIEKKSDLEFLGLREILTEPNIVFVEWPNMISDELENIARPYTKIKIEKISDTERTFGFERIE